MLKKLARQVDENILNALYLYRKNFPIDVASRKYLLQACRQVLSQSPSKKLPKKIPPFLLQNNALAFVTLSLRGKSLSCVANPSENLLLSCVEATKEAIRQLKKSQKNAALCIEICILFNERQVTKKDFFKKYIPGLHGIGIKGKITRAFFKNSVAISSALNPEEMLHQLYQKAKEKGKIFLYDTIEFREDILTKRNPFSLLDLFRFSPMLLQKEITPKKIKYAISIAESFIENAIQGDGDMIYEINPLSGKKIFNDSRAAIIRKIASLWAISATSSKIKKAKRHLDQALDFNDLSMMAFAIFLENRLKNIKRIKMLSQHLMHLWKKEDLHDENIEHWFDRVVAVNALLIAYEHTQKSEYLEEAKKAFSLCKKLLKNSPQFFAFCAWVSRFSSRLYELTRDSAYARFVIQLNKKCCQTQIKEGFPLLDAINAFDMQNHTRATAIYLESLIEACLLAKELNDQKNYRLFVETIYQGLRPLLQNQLDAASAFYPEALGAFKESTINCSSRIDTTQHALFALKGAFKIL